MVNKDIRANLKKANFWKIIETISRIRKENILMRIDVLIGINIPNAKKIEMKKILYKNKLNFKVFIFTLKFWLLLERVLDNGFIRLVDFMGGDFAVVQSARVSFGQESKGPEKDIKLIEYLLKNKHETPFEHSVFKFHIKCPIFVARQWFRHRIGSFNEISLRYVEYKDEFYIPEFFRKQSQSNKQASTEEIVENSEILKEELLKLYEEIKDLYNKFLNSSVARELARIILPLSTYTQFYWTINARSLMNFISLRADINAQYEIRIYARKIAKIFRDKMPITFKFYVKYAYFGKDEEIYNLENEMENWDLEKIYKEQMDVWNRRSL
ncbi:MAG: FAD-dependent thymidylate synthase [candidate division WOR-3 bacterium]